MTWIAFLLAAAGLVYAAYKLTVYADSLAELLGLTRSWVGLLIVGLVTSLPELATTVSSVTKVDSPDMALGNIFGSVIFNLLIIAICDLVFRQGGILRRMDKDNILSATWDILILCAMLFGLLFPVRMTFGGAVFNGVAPIVLLIGLGAFWSTYKQEHSEVTMAKAVPEPSTQVDRSGHVIRNFLIAAAGVVILGYALAVVGDSLAEQTGMTRTFVGTLFLAVATSLPELIVSITAIRMGAYELLLGNVLGSNIWNIMIVAISDFAYRKEAFAIPGNLGYSQLYSGLLGVLATCVVIITLIRGGARRKLRLPFGLESLVLVGLYLVCIVGLFLGWSAR